MSSFTSQTYCVHCGSECGHDALTVAETNFCCSGCKMVYDIIQNNNLCEYYNIHDTPGIKTIYKWSSQKFDYLSNKEIVNQLISFRNGEEEHVEFYLPQIHCSSCLWLLERLYQINPAIISSRVNFYNKKIYITYDSTGTNLKEVVELLASLAYEPHISLDGKKNTATEYDDQYGLSLGIAGFCFGNVMLMSLAEYFSAGTMEYSIHTFISIASIVISLPSLLYSARHFYMSAWKGLRKGILNIDFPIVLALFITFGRSLYEIASGTGIGYLDSMTGIIFFMLISRWLQSRTYKKIFFDKDYKSFFPVYACKIVNGISEYVELTTVKAHDILRIHSNEIIPVDGILSKGSAQIDYSFVSGESNPVVVEKGELVYSGGRQLGSNLEIVVAKEFSKSKLISLWNNSIFRTKHELNHDEYDKIANYFTLGVIMLGGIAGMYWMLQKEYTYMWNAIVTVLIVACPCALLLSKNFTYGNIARILSYNGFFLRSTELISRFNKVSTFVFDKTGTLTQPYYENVNYFGNRLEDSMKRAISSLLNQSTHPLGKSIQRFLLVKEHVSVDSFKEYSGKGIEGWIEDRHIKIGSADFVKISDSGQVGSVIFVMCDSKLIGKFIIHNSYRDGIDKMFAKLKNNFKILLLSGDNANETENIKKFIGQDAVLKFNQSPQDKLHSIKELQDQKENVVMVGDGLNDSGAFQQSDIAICVADDDKGFTPACDAIIEGRNLHLIPEIVRFLQSGKITIKVIFGISAVYNLIGLYFALQGILTPLVAAILMPLSSVTIIGLSYLWSLRSASKLLLKTTTL
ncbi:MAG: HAD-IC family P-type ATPase [Saprospiraceae bacterium]|nr:HAD-IC family P-type ATPase [Saprospiraceae bacterium]